MNAVAAVALLVLVAVAGCSGNDAPTMHTCKDGSVVALGSEERPDGFDAESLCAKPIPPSVRLDASSYTVGVFRSLAIGWSVDNSTLAGGHTMLTVVRLSHHSMSVEGLVGPDAYGVKELLRVEHQNLPAAFNLSTSSGAFADNTLVGTRYLRAYATIQGDGVLAKDYWSEEVAINITGVAATGVIHTVVHGPGGFQGGLAPSSLKAKLGDAIEFENGDVLSHTFTQTKKPACAAPSQPVVLAAGAPTHTKGPSPPILLLCPGEYSFETDDAPSKLTVAITANLD